VSVRTDGETGATEGAKAGPTAMLAHLPKAVGHALRNRRPGLEKTLYQDAAFADVPGTIVLESPAFADGGVLPRRYTLDGEKLSPPLTWSGIPKETRSLCLVIEDADSPTSQPLTHAIVLDLPPDATGMEEGALKSPDHPGAGLDLGKNSFFKSAYLPPDPPPGHGEHRYLFQLYALDGLLQVKETPSLSEVRAAMAGRVLARGSLIGLYSRD
jgi:Raf kinase inhibitor-like YbhB/YbcL family protein